MASAARRYDLDWLRVLLFGLLVPYHAAIGFVVYGHNVYGYRNQDVAGGWLEMLLFFSHNWRLPALFMISGVGTWFLLRKSARGYLAERVLRLGAPLLVGMLIWNAPYGYLQALAQGEDLSFAAFYAEWLATFRAGHARHLWFLMNLLAYSAAMVLAAPALKRLPPISLLTFAAAMFLTSFLIDVTLKPMTYARPFDWRDFWYPVFFVGGFVAMAQPDPFWRRLIAIRWPLLAFGVTLALSFMLIYPMVAPAEAGLLANGGWIKTDWGFVTPATLIHSAAYSANAVVWCGVIFAFAGRRLNRFSPALRTMNRAIYPVYIFHFPIMMAGLYALRAVAWPWQVEWALLTGGTFLLSALAFRIMDQTRATQLMVGLKPAR